MCYSPLSEYEFHNLKDDQDIKKALNLGNIYLVCCRPRLLFKDLSLQQDELTLTIVQRTFNKSIQVHIPLRQEKLWDGQGICKIEYGHYEAAPSTPTWFDLNCSVQKKNVVSEYDCIKLYKDVPGKESEFIIWFSPERLIHLGISGTIKIRWTLDFQEFFNLMNYEVLYVGRTCNMHHRQSTHEHVLEMLAKEQSRWGDLPSHEICFVSINVTESHELLNLQKCPSNPDLTNEQYYYDLEKALIRALDPYYNKGLYLNYPNNDSECLIHNDFDYLIYQFTIPMIINCKGTQIRGFNDCIRVSKSGSVDVIEYEIFSKALLAASK